VINVLVVDDSAFMRKLLTTALAQDPEICVLDAARDGDDALEKIRRLNPDVVTLDVDMPHRGGLSVLEEIMKTAPRPVLMISSLTVEGAEITLKCLDAGALDFIPKQNMHPEAVTLDLLPKIKAVARRRSLFNLRRNLQGPRPTSPTSAQGQEHAPSAASFDPAPPVVGSYKPAPGGPRDLVAIGVSTGGPPAVQKVLSGLPKDFPASILIAQHMPAAFTGPFAKRLDSLCAIKVKEAEQGEKLQLGCAYVAPGGRHMLLERRGAVPELTITTDPESELYKPSATVLMNSVAKINPRKTLGVILTGMGSDGCIGVKTLKENGGYILAQSEATCVVYGMPKAVVDAGLADQIIDIDEMTGAILAAVQGR
jgi:two-component system chemotaxis response regulator CheB